VHIYQHNFWTDKLKKKRTIMARRPDPANRSKGKKTRNDRGSQASKGSRSHAEKESKLTSYMFIHGCVFG
jgi:hypothetical protein